jgi:hypothetical protein
MAEALQGPSEDGGKNADSPKIFVFEADPPNLIERDKKLFEIPRGKSIFSIPSWRIWRREDIRFFQYLRSGSGAAKILDFSNIFVADLAPRRLSIIYDIFVADLAPRRYWIFPVSS